MTNIKVQNADRLNMNQLIMVGADKYRTGIIRYKEIKSNEQGEEILTVRGYTLGIITKQRITIPPEGQEQDRIEACAEGVMKHYIRRNCIDNPDMAFPMLSVADNKARGNNLSWQTRYKNLEEELDSISKVSGLGWNIYPDFHLKKWIFEVYEGRNLTVNQTRLPPVIFSPEFDNVKTQEFYDNITDYGNFAIVAGKGEGIDREIAMIGSEATGLDRYVVFVDARDVEDSSNLIARGERKLTERQRTISYQSEITRHGPFQYKEDWDIGDVVTVQNKTWKVTMDTRITEVTETYEPSGFKLHVTFGSSLPTFSQKLKTTFQELNNEITK